MQRFLALVDVLHELRNAALVVEDLVLFGLQLVDEFEGDARVQVGSSRMRVLKMWTSYSRLGEDASGRRSNAAACRVRPSALPISFTSAYRNALLVALHIDLAVALDGGFHPGRESVRAATPTPCRPPGGLVAAAAAELAAGVEHGHDDLQGRDAHLLVDVDRDAATVILNADRVIRVDGDGNLVAVAGEGFVDGVVDDFPEHLVQAALAVVADVHAGPLADGLEAFEDLDLVGIVIARDLAQDVVDVLELVVFGLKVIVVCHAARLGPKCG